MKISVIGLGKAGLPLATVIADSGIEVIGVDTSKERVDAVNNGINPIPEEPELGELLKKHGGKTLKAVTMLDVAFRECSAYIVIVPLFIDKNKKPDFSILKGVIESLARGIKENDLVVLETTVPPGTTNAIIKPLLDAAGKKYYLAHSPERIMTGYSISRYREFPKVVGGVDEESGKKAFELYSRFCKKAVLVSNATTAELIKVSEGVFRDVNIAIGNELFKVAEKLGVDIEEVKEKSRHEFCNIIGPGNVGGHCIPLYPWFLINNQTNNFDVPLIKQARKLNDSMIEYYADKLLAKNIKKEEKEEKEKEGEREKGKKKEKEEKGKIAVLGLTYRENVKELAYSRSLAMAELLKNKGYEVYANDPMLSKQEIEKLGLKFTDDFEEMDGIMLMNKCEEYKERLIKIKNRKDNIIDIKGLLKQDKQNK